MIDAGRHFLYLRYSGFLRMPLKHLFSVGCLIVILCCTSWQVKGQNYQELIEIADDYYQKEHFFNAAQYYQVAVGLQPAEAEVNYRLAQSYRALFNYPLAAIYYSKTQEADSLSYPLARFYLGQMQKSQGQFALARQNFEAFIDLHQDRVLLDPEEANTFLTQAAIEKEGCLWALEQMSLGWFETGFRHLPAPVNSVNNDYAPAIATNDSSVTITSGRRGVKGSLTDNRYGEYFTDNLRFEKKEEWRPYPDTDKFSINNTKFNDGAGTYNQAGDKYYFTSCYEDNAYCRLYVSRLVKGRWRTPRLLNDNINLPGFDNRHPTFSADGDTIIFVSNRPGGNGGNDLWYSIDEGDDDWGPPQLVPAKINTPFNEVAPHIRNGILFFSSDGLVGMGGMDVFMVKDWMDQSSQVRNIGLPFNSGLDDNFLSLGSATGYISSNRGGGLGQFDIYSFDWTGNGSPWEYFADPKRQEEQLQSRVRQYDPSNLYAARDEDQFYYDNLTAEERAHIDRILAAKKLSANNFDPQTLAAEDLRYYRRLDIPTKAIIERLAERQILGEELNNPILLMDPVAQSDWLFYQNLTEEERAVVDRIINAKLAHRQEYLAKRLNGDELEYLEAGSRPVKYRVEARAQLQAIDSMENELAQQMENTRGRISWLETIAEKETRGSRSSEIVSILQRYNEGVADLPLPERTYYHSLTPVQRNEIYRQILRQQIESASLAPNAEQVLIRDKHLDSPPPDAHQAADVSQNLRKATLDRLYQSISEGLEGFNNETDLKVLEAAVTNSLKAQMELLELDMDKGAAAQQELDSMKQDLQNNWTFAVEEAADSSIEEKIAGKVAVADLQFELSNLSEEEAAYYTELSPLEKLKFSRLPYWVSPSLVTTAPAQLTDWKSGLSAEQQQLVASLPAEDQAMLDQYLNTTQTPDEQSLEEILDEIDPDHRQEVWEIVLSQYPGILPRSSVEGYQMNLSGYLREAETREIMAGQPVSLTDRNGMVVASDTTNNQGYFEFAGVSADKGMRLKLPGAQSNNQNFILHEWSVTRAEVDEMSQAIQVKEETTDSLHLINTPLLPEKSFPEQSPTNSAEDPSLLNVPFQDLAVGAVIYFDFDSYQLRPEAQNELLALAAHLEKSPDPVVLWFGGHADNLGSRLYNIRLSEKRGRQAAEYMKQMISGIRDSILAFGEATPVFPNTTGWGRSYNRRVEVRLPDHRLSDYKPANKTFLVKPGVSLHTLAEATGLTVAEIMELNSMDQKRLKSYQPIRLPQDIDFEKYYNLVYDPETKEVTPEYARFHKVEYGETFYGLARQYETTVQSLERINGITADKLKAGTRIRIR